MSFVENPVTTVAIAAETNTSACIDVDDGARARGAIKTEGAGGRRVRCAVRRRPRSFGAG